MNKFKSSASQIKINSFDDLFGASNSAQSNSQMLPLNKIHPFPNHPFKVLDDEKMDVLVESIKENGVLTPVIVRTDKTGNYEMISGHRRLHAAGLAGLNEIPAIVNEMSDDEAIIRMVDSNIQGEEILPSERAFSFKMKMDAMKRQGQRNDLTSGQNVPKSASDVIDNLTLGQNVPKLTSDVIGEENGMSGRQVKRYIRLTELIPELLEYTDNKKIALTMGVELSYLNPQVQKWVYEYFNENGSLKPVQVAALREVLDQTALTQQAVLEILKNALSKPKESGKLSISEKKLNKYFPTNYSAKQREDIIISLLEQWAQNQTEEKLS